MTYILFGGTCVLHIINGILSGVSEHSIIVWSTMRWSLSSATGSLNFGPVDILGWMVLFFRGLSCSQVFSSVPDLCTQDVSSTCQPPSHHSQQCQWCRLGKRWQGRQNQSKLRTTNLLSLPFRNLQESICTCAKLEKYLSFTPSNCFPLVYVTVVMPRSCRTVRNWNNGSFSTLQLLLYSCLTPKLKASSIYICHVCYTANLLLGSLQVTAYLVSSLNLRKEDHSSLPGTGFKVCFSICVFDFFFSTFHSTDEYVPLGSQFPHRFWWSEQFCMFILWGWFL